MIRKRPLLSISWLFLVPSLAILMGCLALSARAAISTAAIGKAAPAFNLPNVGNGHQTSLHSLVQGKRATVVIFVSTQCPVSNAYTGRMADLAKKFTPRGISFVGIDSNHTEPIRDCALWASNNKLGFPVLKDEGNHIADSYGASHTPEVYVVDSSGKLVYHGRVDSSIDPTAADHHDLADALTAILAGKPIDKPETKAFGCTIRRVGD